MSNDNILLLAKKLKELAERGIGGEKENAEKKLSSLMQKYGITPEMLEENLMRERSFEIGKFPNFDHQIITSVIGRNRSVYKSKRKIKGKHYLYVELTDIEFIEISEKIAFYSAKYEQDLDLFYTAFIQRNRLFVKKDDSESPKNEPKLTNEEKIKRAKTFNMMMAMEAHQFQKTIENG